MNKKLKQKLTDNLMKYYELSVSCKANMDYGLNWYENHNTYFNQVSHGYGIPLEKTVGIASALSPSIPWSRAVRYTDYLIEGKLDKVKCYTNQVDKAVKILELPNGNENITLRDSNSIPDILSGNKTTSFYYNLLLKHDESITLDRHAFRILYDCPKTQANLKAITPLMSDRNKYESHCDVYRYVSEKVRINPSYKLQALTWNYYTLHPYKQLCFSCA
jgi:hypothetical protein